MNKQFWTLFNTQFLGAFNDNIFKNALVILITFSNVFVFGLDPKILVPLAGGIFIFPFFIFSGTAGQMADHFSKKTLIKWIKFGEVLIMSFATVAFYIESFELLFIALFIMGTQSAFFGPLKYGIIPSLVKQEQIIGANAYVTAGTFAAILLGTLVGGTLAGIAHPELYICLCLLFVAVAGWISSLQLGQDTEKIDSRQKVNYTLLAPSIDVLKKTIKDKQIFILIMGISWFWFLGAAILSLLPIMVKVDLAAGSSVATLFLSFFTIGMGLGSFLTKKISANKAEHGLITIGMLGVALMLFLTYAGLQEKSHVITGLGVLLLSVFGGTFMVTQISAIQEIADLKILSSIVAGNNIWNALFMVAAAGFIMLLANTLSTSQLIGLLGVLSLFASFIFYLIYREQTLRSWAKIVMHIFYKVEVRGAENIPESGPLLLVGNHVTFIDWLFLMGTSERPIRFVIDWNYYYSILRPIMVQGYLIPIATKKESEEVLTKAFNNIYKNLEEGRVLGIFAEGWLSRDGKMRPLQPGVNKILRTHTANVVLVGLDGLWGSFFSHYGKGVFRHFPKLGRRKVLVTFSKVIKSDEYNRVLAQKWFTDTISHY